MWVFLVLTTDKFTRGMSGIPVKSQNCLKIGFKDHRVKLTVKFLPRTRNEWRQQGEQVQHTGRAVGVNELAGACLVLITCSRDCLIWQ